MTMKSLISTKNVVIALMILILCLNGSWWCFGEEEGREEEEQGIIEILAPMEREEKEALYKVVQGFVGRWWNGSDLYPDPCGWTPIQGVSCDLYDGLWYVTDLNIGPVHENSLGCATKVEFMPQLFELKHLKSLSFFNCFTSHHRHQVSIPTTSWERLGDLELLEFRSNPGLTGRIPGSLGSLAKLRSLVLLENGLVGQLPFSIGSLVNLERLVLAGNKLTGPIPDSFGGLDKLLILDLSRNSLSGPMPTGLRGLGSLLKLDLSNNLLEGEIPSGVIEGMKCLTLLDLSGNRFSGGLGFKQLGNLNSLEQMVLSNNPSIGGDLKGLEWEKLERLAILDLSNTGLTGEIPDSIVGLKRLRFLGLSDNSLSGDLSPKLETLPSVGAMYLNGNNLTGELKFSEWFYGKMGRRFGAWDNPNLCYPIGLSPPSHVPFGVNPCQPKVNLVGPSPDAHLSHDSHLVASFGFPANYCSGALWWLVSLELLLVTCRSFS